MLAIQEGNYIFCLGMYNLNETFIYRPKSTLLTSSFWTCVSDSLALSLSALSNFTGQAATKNDLMLSPNEGIAPFPVTSSPGFASSPQGDVTSWYTPIPIDAPRAAKTAFSEPDIRCGGRFRPWGYRGGMFCSGSGFDQINARATHCGNSSTSIQLSRPLLPYAISRLAWRVVAVKQVISRFISR